MTALLITEQETRLVTAIDAAIEQSFDSGVSNGVPVLPALTGYDKLNANYRSIARKGIEGTLAPLITALRTTAPTYNAPVYENGFVDFGTGLNGPEQVGQWYVNWDGEIVIRGTLFTPAVPATKTIFRLPAGATPATVITFAQTSAGSHAVVQVYPDGSVFCVSATALDSLTINIRFRPG